MVKSLFRDLKITFRKALNVVKRPSWFFKDSGKTNAELCDLNVMMMFCVKGLNVGLSGCVLVETNTRTQKLNNV